MSELQKIIKNLGSSGKKECIIHKTSFRNFHYTYKQISKFIDHTPKYFSTLNLKKGDRVLIWGPNSPEYIVLLLGCFFNGLVAVPVDIKHPLDVVKKIKQHSGSTVVFSPAEFPSVGGNRVNISDLFFQLEEIMKLNRKQRKKVGNFPYTNLPESALAEIIYTSGTTGTPKGVMLSHKNLVSNTLQCFNGIPLDGERILNVLPLSHSFSQIVTFFPLFFKNTVVLLDVLKPSLLIQSIKEHKITTLPTVPRLLESLQKKLPRPHKLTSKLVFGKLRRFIVGGAPLSVETQEFFNKLGYPCYIGYGLTETSPVLTLNSPGHSKVGSAGRAVENTKIKISKDGEVLAKGPQVFSGYYKNAKKTKEVFSSGWFKTGDLGKIDSDGYLFLSGRKKDVIVTSAGVNVYPDDIQRVLNKHSSVSDSCVIGVGKDADKVHAVLLLNKKMNVKEYISKVNTSLDEASRIIEWSVWPEADFPRTPTTKVRKFMVKEWVEKQSSKNKKSIHTSDKLLSLLKRFTSKKITESSSLESLGLSSLDRVELISTLEQQYSKDLDEDKFTGTLTVRQLRKLLLVQNKPRKLTTWQLRFPVRVLRKIIRPILVFLFAKPFVKMKVEGLENLRGLDEPVIFIANHQSHFDTTFMFENLPNRFSHRLCPATWKEYFSSSNIFKRWFLKGLECFVKILYPIFLLPQKSGALSSLTHMGWLLDHGWNILFFPEGTRTRDGKLVGFRSGIGLLVKNTRAVVVPVRIRGLFDILPSDTFFPRRGEASYHIGEPLRFTTESPLQITKKLEKIIQKL